MSPYASCAVVATDFTHHVGNQRSLLLDALDCFPHCGSPVSFCLEEFLVIHCPMLSFLTGVEKRKIRQCSDLSAHIGVLTCRNTMSKYAKVSAEIQQGSHGGLGVLENQYC